ncbi:MAG TPA: hypothetical protein VD928_00490 [Candidatus Paceibacterota bacterium]|nr:hypothetical protein [Candidatus Paceibacterota bacterium]
MGTFDRIVRLITLLLSGVTAILLAILHQSSIGIHYKHEVTFVLMMVSGFTALGCMLVRTKLDALIFVFYAGLTGLAALWLYT